MPPHLLIKLIALYKGRTIKKLMGETGGGGAFEVQKKYSRKGKKHEKNSCIPINPNALVSKLAYMQVLYNAQLFVFI